MSTSIVIVNVSEAVASAPSQLQRTGALISQGGTTLAAGTSALLTQNADLTALLKAPIAISSISWTSSVVTVVTAAAHGIPAGGAVQGQISGVVPSGYNGTFACTEVNATTFTYPLASNPGSETTLGTFQLDSVSELTAMGDTFFAQGNTQAVYVLELGAGTPAAGVTALSTYLTNPAKQFYAYLVPMTWDTETTAPTLFRQYDSPTSATYFLVTTTAATYSAWATIPTKAAYLVLQSPSAPTTEFSAAAMLYAQLSADPGPVNLVAPLEYRYLFGVTPYTLSPSNATTYKAAGLNWVGTGAEGGISNTLIVNGVYGDLNPWNFWYSVDWMIINQDMALSAAVINGSNSPTNPLYYNQAGINQLQKVSQQVVNNGIAFGMVLNSPPPTVTAIPFSTYVVQEPGDYAIGKYAGLALTFTPARGFDQIVVNLTVSNIANG